MEQNMQEMKANLKKVLSCPGDPDGDWVDAGEVCRKFNMENLAYEVQLQLPDFSVSLSHGKRNILIDNYSNNTHGVIGIADNGTYRISDGNALFAYLSNDGYFLSDDTVEEVAVYAAGIMDDNVIVKFNDTYLSLCINNVKIENIVESWEEYAIIYSAIVALKQQH